MDNEKLKLTYFDGYDMSSLRVRSKDFIVFILSKSPDESRSTTLENILYKTVFYYPNDTEDEQWDSKTAVETHSFMGDAASLPTNQWIFIDHQGGVLRAGNGEGEWEEDIPTLFKKQTYTYPISVKGLENGHMYVTSHYMQVWRRNFPNSWTLLEHGLPEEKKKREPVSFLDIDGFSDNDLYACGDKGNLWHWNGKTWKWQDIPSNASIEQVLCAGDGNVYLYDNGGKFIVGRNDRWKVIEQNDFDWYWVDSMVWFKDRVYVSTQSQLFELNDNKLELSPLDKHKNAPTYWSKMSARDGVLVAGSSEGAVIYDGKDLKTIF